MHFHRKHKSKVGFHTKRRQNRDALRDLVLFVKFEKREKHPCRRITFSKIAGFTKFHPPWVFFTFF